MRTKLLTLLSFMLVASMSVSAQYKDKDFTRMVKDEKLEGWYLKLRNNDQELAKKIFAVEKGGMMHIFNDEFPDKYDWGQKNTHGLMYTTRDYSFYILRFEYKWGKKTVNNYNQWQYDGGVYYHVINDRIWPVGIEYQVRYNDKANKNHTGDIYVSNEVGKFERYTDGRGSFLLEKDGGKLTQRNKLYHAAKDKFTNFNGVNDQWNECEVIVMGNDYCIHKLNGEIVNMATDLGFTKGKIGFQSETAEIFYRNIRIMEFDKAEPMENFLN